MKSFVVIGLGRFGTAVATELAVLGHEVLAVDKNEAAVTNITPLVTYAVTADGQNMDVLRSLGVSNYECGIVALSDDIGKSALIALTLKEIGVKHVICKAQNHLHRKLLEKIGVDRIVFPEHEMGVKLAQNLTSANVLNFIALTEKYGIVETVVPKSWEGKSLRALNVRARSGVNIIGVRRKGEDAIKVNPSPDDVLYPGDEIVALGADEDIGRLHKL